MFLLLHMFNCVIYFILGISLWMYSENVQLEGDTKAEPEHNGGITYLNWPGKASASPQDLLYVEMW